MASALAAASGVGVAAGGGLAAPVLLPSVGESGFKPSGPDFDGTSRPDVTPPPSVIGGGSKKHGGDCTIFIAGIRGSADLKLARRIAVKATGSEAGSIWAVETQTFVDEQDYTGWLEECKPWRATLGKSAERHAASDGVFIVIEITHIPRISDLKPFLDGMIAESQAPNLYLRGLLALVLIVVLVVASVQVAFLARDGKLEVFGVNAPHYVYRERVESFYKEHNPEKLEDPVFVSGLMRKYQGREPKLLEKLRRKYENSEAREEL